MADALLDDSLLARIKAIQVRARYLASDALAGGYESAFKGQGLAFEDVRAYTPGDDVRAIDWNVTARAGHPYIKTYRDERELTVVFVVDLSGSTHFGSQTKFKSEIAAEICALLAYTALRSHDKVGLVVATDRVEHSIPAKRGRSHIWSIIREILAYRSTHRATKLGEALDHVNHSLRRRAVIVLISDFLDEGYELALRTTARKHQVIAIGLRDRRETGLPALGYVALEDAETGEEIVADTSNAYLRERFAAAAAEQWQRTVDLLRAAGVDLIELAADRDFLDPILRYFSRYFRRNKRGRRG